MVADLLWAQAPWAAAAAAATAGRNPAVKTLVDRAPSDDKLDMADVELAATAVEVSFGEAEMEAQRRRA